MKQRAWGVGRGAGGRRPAVSRLKTRIAQLLLCCALCASGAFAQETETAPAQKKEAAKPAADAGKPQETTAKPADAAEAKKPAKDATGTPQRFVPSEQVRSDFDVSFPVDI